MLRRSLKYLFILLGCSIFVLAVTNPSIKNLREYIGNNDGVFRRTQNWIIFSKYEYSFVSQVYSNKYRDLENYTYIGIFSNFYKIKSEKKIINPKKSGAEKYDWIIK